MTKEKTSWDDIPSLDGLEVDWTYTPDNPLGKRTWIRIINQELHAILGVKTIPVKVASKNFEETGYILDIARGGLAVFLKNKLSTDQPVKLGFFLGRHKLITNGIIRNVSELDGRYRTGIEFIELEKEHEDFISGIISSKIYQPV